MKIDSYTSVEQIAARLTYDVHYRVKRIELGSALTIIAPHGGFIEPGTSAVAASIAGRTDNLFDFQALRIDEGRRLHVTSTKFRHPDLDRMLARSRAAISVHALREVGKPVVWVGGRNHGLRRFVAERLDLSGFLVNSNSPRCRGEKKDNVVNRVRRAGVQLELSEELMHLLFPGERFDPEGGRIERTVAYRRLVRAVRQAVVLWIRSK